MRGTVEPILGWCSHLVEHAGLLQQIDPREQRADYPAVAAQEVHI